MKENTLLTALKTIADGPWPDEIEGPEDQCRFDMIVAKKAIESYRDPMISTWFSLVMCAAAELEDASHCLNDDDAKAVCHKGADYYRKMANHLWKLTANKGAGY